MSGARAPGTNVVPMPTNGAPPTAPVPWPQPGMWPMPSAMAGCCPPSNLMQCYCDIQNATAFICAVMVDCINTNPAVAEAMIAAIQKSGSNLPLLGVTDGSAAQPGQVGEVIRFQQTFTYPTTPLQQTLSMGVLPPGDWDCWYYVNTESWTTSLQSLIGVSGNSGPPVGFDDQSYMIQAQVNEIEAVVNCPNAVTARLSVPTLVPIYIFTNNVGAGNAATGYAVFYARRRR